MRLKLWAMAVLKKKIIRDFGNSRKLKEEDCTADTQRYRTIESLQLNLNRKNVVSLFKKPTTSDNILQHILL
jgi:hypothetical protein